MKKIPVGVLGATGMVGQSYVQLLSAHPLFEVVFIAGSQQSAFKSYGAALRAKGMSLEGMPQAILDLPVRSMDDIAHAKSLARCVFSAVDTQTATIYERLYAESGLAVVSNTAAHRMDEDVPLLIPEVNPEHIKLIDFQKKYRNGGFIVAKPNCSLQSYLIPLFPIHQVYGITKLVITTMQAISGAGYPGISSLDIMDNVIPYISGEEEKSEQEPLKILGSIVEGRVLHAQDIAISAHCNRVPVRHGHTVCVCFGCKKKPRLEEIQDLWNGFTAEPQELRLHSAPARPIFYTLEKDRPQPLLDRDRDRGMSVTVGRLRPCPIFDGRFVALSHNTLRGAALGGILNAELLHAKGYL